MTGGHWESQVPIGDLMVGEVPRWNRGVCEVLAVKDGEMVTGNMLRVPDHIVVRGENGYHIEKIPLDGKTPEGVDGRIAKAIRNEMEAL